MVWKTEKVASYIVDILKPALTSAFEESLKLAVITVWLNLIAIFHRNQSTK